MRLVSKDAKVAADIKLKGMYYDLFKESAKDLQMRVVISRIRKELRKGKEQTMLERLLKPEFVGNRRGIYVFRGGWTEAGEDRFDKYFIIEGTPLEAFQQWAMLLPTEFPEVVDTDEPAKTLREYVTYLIHDTESVDFVLGGVNNWLKTLTREQLDQVAQRIEQSTGERVQFGNIPTLSDNLIRMLEEDPYYIENFGVGLDFTDEQLDIWLADHFELMTITSFMDSDLWDDEVEDGIKVYEVNRRYLEPFNYDTQSPRGATANGAFKGDYTQYMTQN